MSTEPLRTIRLKESGEAVIIIDQTQLPLREVYIELTTEEEIYDAIKKLKVRGAPAIGIAAAFGIYVCCKKIQADSFRTFLQEFRRIRSYFESSRPTAVNLSAALSRMEKVVTGMSNSSVQDILTSLRKESEAIFEEDVASCLKIGQYGLSLLHPGMGILTHCNAGCLAVSQYGTALSPLYLGEKQGYHFKVYADETRPLLQGARLTAYELQRSGIDVTLICDDMASYVMQRGLVQCVLVGCDRVARNGDVANKIGTSAVAILAKHYRIPFYVLGPETSIDRSCPNGASISVEQRDASEVTDLWYQHRMAPDNVKVLNPAFDITPHELITAIITEQGIRYMDSFLKAAPL